MKPNKKLLISAGILVILGTAISTACVKIHDAKAISSMQKSTREITEKITKIDIASDWNDVIIKRGNTDKITVSYVEGEKNEIEFDTQNNTLTIRNLLKNKREKWYDYISFDFHTAQYYDIMITVPKDFSAETVLNLRCGDIEISDLKGSLDINSSNGDVEIKRCEFSNIRCDLRYGDIEMSEVSSGNTDIISAYGDIELDKVSGKITAEARYGDIEADMIKADEIAFKSDCGDIDCLIDGKKEDYTINCTTRAGANNIDNIENNASGTKKLDVQANLGDVSVLFTK